MLKIMKIIGLSYINNSKVPGCELGFKYFMSNAIKDINLDKKDILFFEEEHGENKYKKIIHYYLDNNVPILFFGSDHSTTAYILNSLINRKIDSLFIFDAHNDYDNQSTSKHLKNWNILNFIQDSTEVINLLGYRYYHKAMLGNNINIIKDTDFCELSKVIDRLEFSKQDGFNYISIDLDVLNPLEFSSVNFPVVGGISLRELLYCINYIFSKSSYCIIDIVEFNPILDSKISYEVLIRLINEITNMGGE